MDLEKFNKKNEPHHRFLVFGCSSYYPAGDIDDLIGSFALQGHAIEYARNDDHEHVSIYDRLHGVTLDWRV